MTVYFQNIKSPKQVKPHHFDIIRNQQKKNYWIQENLYKKKKKCLHFPRLGLQNIPRLQNQLIIVDKMTLKIHQRFPH